jgi:nitrogen regulatory protein PII
MENIKSFLNKINSDTTVDTPEPEFDLQKSITKELNSQEVYNKLLAAKQEKIKVKEVIMESEIDFITSAKKLKNVFDNQLYEAIEKVTDILTGNYSTYSLTTGINSPAKVLWILSKH